MSETQQPEPFVVDPETLAKLGGGDATEGRKRLRLALADMTSARKHDGPIEKPASVRAATVRDEPAILNLLLEDLGSNAETVAPPDVEQIMLHVERGTRNGNGFVIVVDDASGKPAAVAISVPVRWWWSSQYFLQEVVLYASPRAPAGAGADLLKYQCWIGEEMSREYGHRVFVLAGVTGHRRWESKVRLYGRVMNQIGAFFIFPSIPDGGLTL